MTRITLKYDLYHKWHRVENISVIGTAFHGKDFLKESLLAEYFKNCSDEKTFTGKLNTLSGHFAVVIDLKDEIFSAVDLVRTFPLFLQEEDGGDIVITDTPEGNNRNISEEDYFTKLYCTTENNTLLLNCRQLQAGEYSITDKSLQISVIKKYYHHWGKTNKSDQTELVNKLKELEKNIIDETIRYASGRAILVPLSGGYDSRYILTLLKEKDYPLLECYTYGRKDSYEVLIAKNVAEKLNVKWHFIEYTNELLDNFFSESWKNYSSLNHHFSSLPHEQDFFALLFMKEKGLLESPTVIINGFCQDIHAGSFLEPIRNFDLQKFILLKYHVNPDLSAYENSWNGFQEWLVKNRLSKFIINSVRVYEYFGLDFFLPFWHKDWIEFWYSIDISLRLNHQLYASYLLKDVFLRNGIEFKKPGYESSDRLYSLKRIAKTIIPKMLTEQIQQQHNKDKQRDPNNTLHLYEAIYAMLETKPAVKDYKINHVHARYLLEVLMEKMNNP
jgi:asparagine synthase (glutamine-hydrolysing)